MTRTLAAAVLLLAAPSVSPGAGPSLGAAGAKAFDMARGADDAAAAALEEGERALAQLKALLGGGRDVESLKTLQEEAEAAGTALAGYRAQTQASTSETLSLLAEAARVAATAKPDVVRREVLEQRALLAAHEAAVMGARARAEAERLRAVLAEARVAAAGSRPADPRAAAPAGPASSAGGTGEGSGREAIVPNLVGARLAAAVQALEAVGLRLGATTGPGEGFVVKQMPDAGTRVPRRATVSLTLSATAATTTVVAPR